MRNSDVESEDSAIDEYMNLVGQRASFLEYLCEEPAQKCELIDALNVSRSTVDRALGDLQDAGLVRYVDGVYETSATGVLAVKQYRSYIDQSADIRAAHKALHPLAPDTRLDPAMVVGASVNITEEPRPYSALQPLESSLSDATRIRALLPNIADCRYIELYHDRVDEGADVKLVLAPKLFETLAEQFPSACQQMAQKGNCTVFESDIPSFGVVITDTDGVTSLTVVVYTENGSVHAVIHTGTIDAVQWAEGLYEGIVSEAVEVTPFLQATSNRELWEWVRNQDGLDTAEEYLEEVRALREGPDNTQQMHRNIHSLGVVQFERGNYESARKHLTEAVKKLRPFDESQTEAITLLCLGELALKTNNFDEAYEYTKSAIACCGRTETRDLLLDSHEQLAVICEELEKYQEAIKHCRKAAKLAEEAGLNERYEGLVDMCGRVEGAAAAA